MSENGKEKFGSHFAVIMALAGSAIGLGNIWRFPYIAGEMGGGIFVLVYILCTLFFSIPLFVTEMAIGRSSGKSAANAMYHLSGKKKFWKYAGLVMVLCPLVICSYYSVVGGWAADFLVKACQGAFGNRSSQEVSEMFGVLISSDIRPLAFHLLFMGLTAFVVMGGIQSGIERFSKYTVPVLFLTIVFILVYSLSLPGASQGVRYLLDFDIHNLTPKMISYAMGQSFYSLSLGMGSVITYGSYVRKKENMLQSSCHVAVNDLFFALLAAFVIMPAVFAAGLQPGAGPGLIFQTIPYIFSEMSAHLPIISAVVAVLFFFTILMAALSSAISLMEVGAAYLVETTHWSRRRISLILFLCLGFLGSLCSLSFGPLSQYKIMDMNFFSILDWFSSNILLIAASMLSTVFAGWIMKKKDFYDELSSGGMYSLNAKVAPVIYYTIRYVAPVIIFVVLVSNFI